jgi:hypothetical protein
MCRSWRTATAIPTIATIVPRTPNRMVSDCESCAARMWVPLVGVEAMVGSFIAKDQEPIFDPFEVAKRCSIKRTIQRKTIE